MFDKKYKPTTQKSLFHKDIVNHIRKWIQLIEDNYEDKKDIKQIMFLYGPIGCGKSVTVECLFKNYNLIDIDSDSLRTSEKINDVLQQVVGFDSVTLENIEKWNHKNKRDKKNILCIDNIELCDKGIETFVDIVHVKRNLNIPIILICNNSKYKDVFSVYKNCTFIEFKNPSLLEMSKLTIDINKTENLNLEKDMIRQLIDKSQNDIRQLFFLLEQWNASKKAGIAFSAFIGSIQVKHTDQDLSEKIEYLFRPKDNFNFEKTFQLSSSEPYLISNTIFQNYINLNLEGDSNSKLSEEDNLTTISNMSNIIDNLSYSNLIHNEIYENQQWELYNDYIIPACVLPSYYSKQNRDILWKNNVESYKPVLFNYNTYKDVSYNFINSYDEVKKIANKNIHCNKMNTTEIQQVFATISQSESCFYIVQIILNSIKMLNDYFDKNKRGKNTTKKEKIDLCNNIQDENIKQSLDKLINIVYNYKLFEINIDECRSKCVTEEMIKNNFQKVDLRVFKRFLNIFTFDDSHKLFKSNVEASIQYKIFERLIQDLKININQKISSNSVEEMTIDLGKIWSL